MGHGILMANLDITDLYDVGIACCRIEVTDLFMSYMYIMTNLHVCDMCTVELLISYMQCSAHTGQHWLRIITTQHELITTQMN